MTTITEIAPDIFRICTYIGDFGMQFNQFPSARPRAASLSHRDEGNVSDGARGSREGYRSGDAPMDRIQPFRV